MTNGEKIQHDFECEVYEPIIEDNIIHVCFADKPLSAIGFDWDWWNAEYKEPTTKNDFGVDCISRADAIQAMQDKAKKLTNEDTINGLCGAVAILFELPSVTPQEPRWIPVSERMPKDGQFVLFCDIDDDSMVGYHVKGRPNTHFLQVGIFEDMKNVRAWMPLPKPYEPQESEVGG